MLILFINFFWPGNNYFIYTDSYYKIVLIQIVITFLCLTYNNIIRTLYHWNSHSSPHTMKLIYRNISNHYLVKNILN